MGETLDRKRLVQILGLLSSEHDGERANAGAMADKMVRAAGLRWPDVILTNLPPPRGQRDLDVSDAIVFCRNNIHHLSEWERDFLASVSSRHPDYLSDKQLAVLDRMVDKCRRMNNIW